MKILLAVDGSDYSNAAVDVVAGRPWPEGSEVKIISAAEVPYMHAPEKWVLPESSYSQLAQAVKAQAESAVREASRRLQAGRQPGVGPMLRSRVVGRRRQDYRDRAPIVGHRLEKLAAARQQIVVAGTHRGEWCQPEENEQRLAFGTPNVRLESVTEPAVVVAIGPNGSCDPIRRRPLEHRREESPLDEPRVAEHELASRCPGRHQPTV